MDMLLGLGIALMPLLFALGVGYMVLHFAKKEQGVFKIIGLLIGGIMILLSIAIAIATIVLGTISYNKRGMSPMMPGRRSMMQQPQQQQPIAPAQHK